MLPAFVVLAVGLGPVIIYDLLQLLHLGNQGLYGVPVIRTAAHEHVAPRSRGRLSRRCCWCRPQASAEAAAVAASRCWLALRFLSADFGALLAAGTCGAETVVLADFEGEGSALAASNCFRTCATRPPAELEALLARPALSASLIAP